MRLRAAGLGYVRGVAFVREKGVAVGSDLTIKRCVSGLSTCVQARPVVYWLSLADFDFGGLIVEERKKWSKVIKFARHQARTIEADLP